MEKVKVYDAVDSYKGFNNEFMWRGEKFEVGETYDAKYETEWFKAHENPLDVFNTYPMIGSRFAKVSQFGDVDMNEENDTEVSSSSMIVKDEISLSDMVHFGIEWLINDVMGDSGEMTEKSDEDFAQIASSGDNCHVISNAYYSKVASSGDDAKIGSKGESSHISSSGNNAEIGSEGESTKIASSGYSGQIVSKGDESKIASSGNDAKIVSDGKRDFIGVAGNETYIASNGEYAQISSSGDCTEVASFGKTAQVAISGNFAKVDSNGENSVVSCVGYESMAKAKKGSWITLAEWVVNEKDEQYLVCVKTEYVDGEKIKADTWYKLSCGEFKECKETE